MKRPPKKQLLVLKSEIVGKANVKVCTHHLDGRHWPTEGAGAAKRRRRQAEKRESK
jgi:hypothetical protein